MKLPERMERLARALAALTQGGGYATTDLARWESRLQRTREPAKLRADADGFRLANNKLLRWRVRRPDEAAEELATAGLVPADACDPGGARRRWTCAACGGARRGRDCPACGGAGSVREPPSVPWLVAWACLGARDIALAEQLARQAAPAAEVVWNPVWAVSLRTAASLRLRDGAVGRPAMFSLASAYLFARSGAPLSARPDPDECGRLAAYLGELNFAAAMDLYDIRVLAEHATEREVVLSLPRDAWAFPPAEDRRWR